MKKIQLSQDELSNLLSGTGISSKSRPANSLFLVIALIVILAIAFFVKINCY